MATREENVDMLWKAAYAYESTRICGMALALIALGLVVRAPKCLAVYRWSCLGIWATYYARKALILAPEDSEGYVDVCPDGILNADLLDFSCCGEIPYTVTELFLEVDR